MKNFIFLSYLNNIHIYKIKEKFGVLKRTDFFDFVIYQQIIIIKFILSWHIFLQPLYPQIYRFFILKHKHTHFLKEFFCSRSLMRTTRAFCLLAFTTMQFV